ncbi:LysR substrate-binding domain-containing protein [Acidocella aromatica]|uniref:DNA-binding transcriptional LysR family regulator n=1 Tax=Acidocella aromatica TaxID=1303579 RepID=A0A840VFA4_9PROT|nr:LysR substrate-binding domain-containing protein [Acidocella aromatica]MBB5374518.1 DNA-binding transcriptional LysR family regulator [Acidocella aromatica]
MGYTPLNALRVFDAVFRHGTFYGAAEELSVTPSAISHQMRHLEEWLGTSLFDRRGKQLKFDSSAVSLAGALRLAFADIDTACQEVRRKNKKQQLTVAVIPSVAICWLIPRLPLFREAHPKIDLKIIYAIFGHETNFEDVDIAIVYAKDKPIVAKMDAVRLLSGASAPVCSQSFVDNHPRLATAEDVAKCNLLHDTDTSGWHAWLGEAYLSESNGLADIIFEDFNLLRAAVLAGQGIALCPTEIIRNDLEAGRLIKLSDRTIDDEYNYFALRRSAPANDPVNIFFDWLSGMVDLT